MYISLRFFVFLCLSILTVSSVSGQTSELAKIRIEGVNEELAANIRNHLAISAESCYAPLSRLNRLALTTTVIVLLVWASICGPTSSCVMTSACLTAKTP